LGKSDLRIKIPIGAKTNEWCILSFGHSYIAQNKYDKLVHLIYSKSAVNRNNPMLHNDSSCAALRDAVQEFRQLGVSY